MAHAVIDEDDDQDEISAMLSKKMVGGRLANKVIGGL